MATEYLTMAEIEKRYPNEWVLIDNLKFSFWSKKMLGGIVVVVHSTDRDEFDVLAISAINTLSKLTASVYTGEEEPDVVYLGLGSQFQFELLETMKRNHVQ